MIFSWLVVWCVLERTHDDGVAQDGGHTRTSRLTARRHVASSLFEIGHPCYDQLTPARLSTDQYNVTISRDHIEVTYCLKLTTGPKTGFRLDRRMSR